MTNPLADPTDRRTQSRRKHPRAFVGWPVTVISTKGTYQGIAADISRGGALIHLSQELTIGENVRLAFEVPDYQDAIVAKGEILRVFPLKRGVEQELSYAAALKFTEISDENLKYFTGDIAPEWKEGYKDTRPVNTNIAPQNASRSTPYLPWILVIILLIPLLYFVYDSIQQRLNDENLISDVESRLLIIEEQINSLQKSLNLLTSIDGQLDDLQLEITNFAIRLPEKGSIEKITQQLNKQNFQIENINQKIKYIHEANSKISKNEQPKTEEQQFYVVQKGDNLFQISSKHGMTIQELKKINGIGPNESIYPGQKLKIKATLKN